MTYFSALYRSTSEALTWLLAVPLSDPRKTNRSEKLKIGAKIMQRGKISQEKEQAVLNVKERRDIGKSEKK